VLHSSESRSRQARSLPSASAASVGLAAPSFISNAARLAAAVANDAPLAWVALAGTTTATAWAQASSPLAKLVPSPELLQAALAAASATEVFPAQPGNDFPALRAGLRHAAGVRQLSTQPLRGTSGQLLGALCVCHTVPAPLSTAQRGHLALLAQQLAAYLELDQLATRPQPEPALSANATSVPPNAQLPEPTTLFVKQEQRLMRLLLQDIHCVEALGDYVNIYTASSRLTVYTTMKEMELKLPKTVFARVHRKYIVRLDRILLFEGDVLHLDTNRAPALMEVPIGSSYKATLMSQLNVV
jgi:LytTr DNA-binding domain